MKKFGLVAVFDFEMLVTNCEKCRLRVYCYWQRIGGI
jgi:hypothetical protein